MIQWLVVTSLVIESRDRVVLAAVVCQLQTTCCACKLVNKETTL